jgi:hypothetical protein
MPVPFDEKTVNYRVKSNEQLISGRTNPLTWSLMKDRYVVLRDFLPKEIIDMAMDMWHADEYTGAYTHQENKDITYKNPSESIGKSQGGYCTPWGIALHGYIHNKLKDYIDMDLRETYSYTRKYERGAYLGSHTDRPSCEISATLCLEYQTDDNTPWKIWVRNDKSYAGIEAEQVKNESQDIPHRLRKENNCTSVALEPGDILVYQGPNIPHWRDYLLGEESYHLFVHFFNADSRMEEIEGFYSGHNHNIKTGHSSMALDLDGRTNRWESGGDENKEETEKKKLFRKFNDMYYKSNYGEFVNDFDHFELVKKRK